MSSSTYARSGARQIGLGICKAGANKAGQGQGAAGADLARDEGDSDEVAPDVEAVGDAPRHAAPRVARALSRARLHDARPSFARRCAATRACDRLRARNARPTLRPAATCGVARFCRHSIAGCTSRHRATRPQLIRRLILRNHPPTLSFTNKLWLTGPITSQLTPCGPSVLPLPLPSAYHRSVPSARTCSRRSATPSATPRRTCRPGCGGARSAGPSRSASRTGRSRRTSYAGSPAASPARRGTARQRLDTRIRSGGPGTACS